VSPAGVNELRPLEFQILYPGIFMILPKGGSEMFKHTMSVEARFAMSMMMCMDCGSSPGAIGV
jgi:hypothetical protein